MELTETARVRLLIDGKEAISELTILENKFAEVNAAKKNFARSSEEFKALNAESKELAKSIDLVRQRMDVANMTSQEAKKYQKDLIVTMSQMRQGTEDYIKTNEKLKEVNTHLAGLRSDMNAVNTEVQKQKSTWESLKGWIVGAFTVVAVEMFLRKLVDLGVGVFDITAKFERYEAVLGNATGTTALATKAMHEIKNMAATTPFTVDELTDSYVKFANRGLMPTQKEMEAMADVAATTGKSFEQLSEALLDGAMGQLKRFTELGISAEKMGDKIKMSFKGVSTVVSMDLEGMNKAMIYFQENAKGVAGATDVIAKTMEGRVSNLKDLWDFARIELGNKLKPLFSDIIDGLYGMVEGLKFAAQNFERIATIVKTVVGAFVAYQVITRAAAAAMVAKNAVMKIQQLLYGQSLIALEAYTGMTIAETEAQIAATTAARGFNAALKANPLMAILTVLTLAVTAYEMYQMHVEAAQKKQEEFSRGVAEAISPLMQERDSFNSLAKSVLDTNEKLDVRKQHLKDLKEKYPDQMKGIDNLGEAEARLGNIIRITNGDFATRAKLLENEYRIKNNMAIYDKAMAEKLSLESKLKTADTSRSAMTVTNQGTVINVDDSEAAVIKFRLAGQQKILDAVTKANQNIADQSDRLTKKIVFNYDQIPKKAIPKIEELTAAEKKSAKEIEDARLKMLKVIEKANELTEKNIRKALEDHVKAVKTNNADELKANEKLQDEIRENALKMADFKDAALKLERVKLAKSTEEIEAIEKEYTDRSLKRDLESSKAKLASKEREFLLLKTMGLLDKEEEDKRKTEILKLKGEVADKETSIIKKGVKEKSDILKSDAAAVNALWEDEVKNYENKVTKEEELEKKKAERIKFIQKEAADLAYTFVQKYMSKAGAEIDQLIDSTTDKVEKARLESRKISNEMGKSFLDTVASFATGDISGGISGLINVLSGAVDLFNQNAKILVAELEVVYDKLSADASFLVDNAGKVKEIYGTMAFNMPNFADYGKITTAIESSISSEIKVGEQINANYTLATDKENSYFDQRKKNIEDAYSLEVQRINDKYTLLAEKANQAHSAESLALQNASNESLLSLIKNEDSKTSIVAEYNTKRSAILKATTMADMEITGDMDAATVKAINDARDLRTKSLSELGKWYQEELVFIVNNEGQKRKEYSETDKIINKLKEDQDALDLKYAMDAIEREKNKTTELVAAEKDKNTQLETENKRHNDTLEALGKAKDAALAESFTKLKDLTNAGYQEMINKAEELYQKGIITADQFIQLINQIRYFKSLMNDGGYTDNNSTPKDVPYIEPIVLPKFGNGGILKDSSYFENHGVLGGLSHNTPEGGNWVVNARTGKIQAKVEAGEWMGIVNKNTTAKYKDLLYTLANSSVATTGKPVWAENGYFGPSSFGSAQLPAQASSVGTGNTELIKTLIAATEENNKLLGSIAVYTGAFAKKRLEISMNEILNSADLMADIDRRSSFS